MYYFLFVISSFESDAASEKYKPFYVWCHLKTDHINIRGFKYRFFAIRTAATVSQQLDIYSLRLKPLHACVDHAAAAVDHRHEPFVFNGLFAISAVLHLHYSKYQTSWRCTQCVQARGVGSGVQASARTHTKRQKEVDKEKKKGD